MVQGDFDIDFSFFLIMREQDEYSEDDFPFAFSPTDDGQNAVYIFTNEPLAHECAEHYSKVRGPSLAVPITDPHELITLLEDARKKDVRSVAIDAPTWETVSRGIYPIDYFIGKIRKALQDRN